MQRRQARELAISFLYMGELRGELEADIVHRRLPGFLRQQGVKNPEILEYASMVIKGTVEKMHFIDTTIEAHAVNWSVRRMAYIDKNILRIATFEMCFLDSIPHNVSINEAIELSKKYGADDSPKFVNGILHKIKETCKKHREKGAQTCGDTQ